MKHKGIYRGVVVDTDDPERRGRVRVHIHELHTFLAKTGPWPGTMDEEFAGATGGSSGFSGSGESGYIRMPLTNDAQQLALFNDYVGLGTYGGHTAYAISEQQTQYPWAEVMAQGGKQSGYHTAFRVGDSVLVMFIGGDSDHPVVLGAAQTASFGITDVPVATTATPYGDPTHDPATLSNGEAEYNYEVARRTHTLLTQAGDGVEVRDGVDEPRIRIKGGDAFIELFSAEDSIVLKAAGSFDVRAMNHTVRTRGEFHMAQSEFIVNVVGTGTLPTGPLGVCPLMGFYSEWEMEMCATEQLAVGQYLRRETTWVDPGGGSADGGVVPDYSSAQRHNMVQTRVGWFAPKIAFLGIACPAQIGKYTTYAKASGEDAGSVFKLTEVVRVEAVKYVSILADGTRDPDHASAGDVGLIVMRAMKSGATAISGKEVDDDTATAGVTSAVRHYAGAPDTCGSGGGASGSGGSAKLNGCAVIWADDRVIIQGKKIVLVTEAGRTEF